SAFSKRSYLDESSPQRPVQLFQSVHTWTSPSLSAFSKLFFRYFISLVVFIFQVLHFLKAFFYIIYRSSGGIYAVYSLVLPRLLLFFVTLSQPQFRTSYCFAAILPFCVVSLMLMIVVT
uniref:YcaO domain-containing protein n=1 Tax=Parascaris univalens TaxID=6257 RepID=A0A915ANZ5_PARUN